MTTEDEPTRACANLTVKHNPDQVQFDAKEPMMDYVLPGKTNIYDLKSLPETDFRMDAFYHAAKIGKMTQKSSIQVSLVGENSQN